PLMKYHAKYFVADEVTALVTTLNCTRKCFESTCDFMVFTRDPQVISGLRNLFHFDSSVSAPEMAPAITQRLIVGPDDSRRRLIRLFSQAASSIRIVDHRVTDPEIIELLRQRERQGLKVHVVA